MKVPPLPCVRLDLRVARMTAKMAFPFPVGAVEYSVSSWYFRTKYIDTPIKSSAF